MPQIKLAGVVRPHKGCNSDKKKYIVRSVAPTIVTLMSAGLKPDAGQEPFTP